MMELLIATTNPGKFKEIAAMLSGLDARFYSLEDLFLDGDFEEVHEAFADNAMGKARFFGEQVGLTTIADDSGVFVSALEGELGVQTRRWGAGVEASDEEWLDFFMERMEGEEDREAKFVCAAALYCPERGDHVFVSEVEGFITDDIEAPVKPGIPLSSVFKPHGSDTVYSAMTVEQKNENSHRSKAFLQLLNFLKNER